MRNSPEMKISFEEDERGLRACLQQHICDKFQKPDMIVPDGALRTCYLQMDGNRIKDKDGFSSVVREHIQVFFKGVFWYLHEYYGKAMSENVMMIAAYREAVCVFPHDGNARC